MKIPTFLKELLQDLAKDYIKWILVAVLSGSLIVFFKKIIAFLNLRLNLPTGIFVACLFLAFLIGYEIFKPKKGRGEISFEKYGDFSWKIEIHRDGWILVDENPYCLECHTEYQIINRPSFGEITLSCPKPDCKSFDKGITCYKHSL